MNETATEEEAHSDVPSDSGGGTLCGPPDGFGKGVNDYLNHYVTVADAKAAAILAVNFVVLQFLLKDNFGEALGLPFHVASLGFLALSCLATLSILFPRLPRGSNGVIFWEDIRDNASPEAYESGLLSIDRLSQEREYAHQNYYVSKVLHRKMRWTQWAIGLFAAGALCSLICAIW